MTVAAVRRRAGRANSSRAPGGSLLQSTRDAARARPRARNAGARRSAPRRRAATGAGVAVVRRRGRRQVGAGRGGLRRRPGLRLLRGVATRCDTPRPLGPFRDLAGRRLGRSSTATPAVSGLRAGVRRARSGADRAGRRGPALGRRRLGRRAPVPRPPPRGRCRWRCCSPTATTRSARSTRLAPLLGDFAALDGLATLAPRAALRRRRSPTLVAGTGLDPEQVHAVTGGNPFFVAEVAKRPRPPAADLGPRRRAGPHRRRRHRTTSRCSSSPPPPRTGSTTGCSPSSASTCPPCGGWTTTGLLPRDEAASSSATSSPGWPWRARSRPAGSRACTPGCSRRWSGSSPATRRC